MVGSWTFVVAMVACWFHILSVAQGLLRREDDCHGFQCKNGCISLSQVCDYANDCGDNGDEIGCGKCSTTEFRCGNKICIPSSGACDGKSDCLDGSDETDCYYIIAATTGSVLGGALILAVVAFSSLGLYCWRSRKKSLREQLNACVVANTCDPNEGTILMIHLEDIPGDDIPSHSSTSADGPPLIGRRVMIHLPTHLPTLSLKHAPFLPIHFTCDSHECIDNILFICLHHKRLFVLVPNS
eukprot:Em0454g2a